VLYLFVPGDPDASGPRRLRLVVKDEEGGSVGFVAAPVAWTPAFRVFRVQVFAYAGMRFSIEHATWCDGCDPPEGRRRYSYRVVGHWKRAARTPVRMLGVENDCLEWPCSSQFSRNLTVDRYAYAYRIEWAATVVGYRAGRRQSFVVPYDVGELWRCAPPWRPVGRPMLKLGYLNCMDTTGPWGPPPRVLSPALPRRIAKALRRVPVPPLRPGFVPFSQAVFVGVAALYPDGTEDPPAAEPTRVEPPTREGCRHL
jgi:hypothetical protein